MKGFCRIEDKNNRREFDFYYETEFDLEELLAFWTFEFEASDITNKTKNGKYAFLITFHKVESIKKCRERFGI